ncbi:MAG: hypothetical protein VB087_05615 [Candidatus Limiplasma sp.]|nr:hypothetical protein [Candidatus Limiplasma sp.]
MKMIIASKTYDTETAKPLGDWQRGSRADRGFISETLYQKKTGEYFLHGEGGSRSRYAQRVAPNTWHNGERIIPMGAEEAHAWAETHLTENAFDKVFGANAHDEPLTPVLLRLKPDLAEKLLAAAQAQRCQPADVAEALIAKAFGIE